MIIDKIYKNLSSLENFNEEIFNEVVKDLEPICKKIENFNASNLSSVILKISEEEKWQESHLKILQEIQEEI